MKIRRSDNIATVETKKLLQNKRYTRKRSIVDSALCNLHSASAFGFLHSDIGSQPRTRSNAPALECIALK